ncbi:hypothetical protein GOBAR_AA26191 [Gossypium barbadense]|uniref:Uncharacterized protein n=1 Tax=Gossypium barbadense TaxID=3634 RepID=A0A2P5WTT7_GOSBA|nr:hypothetical protein GOBAR_AA26191 [Gossypium barbadense]
MHELPLDTDQEKKVDVNDDSARQLMFYTQALEGTRLAFEKFQSMGRAGVGSKRPKRGKSKEAKRIAKEVQAEKLKERAKQKKQEIEAVKSGGNKGSRIAFETEKRVYRT